MKGFFHPAQFAFLRDEVVAFACRDFFDIHEKVGFALAELPDFSVWALWLLWLLILLHADTIAYRCAPIGAHTPVTIDFARRVLGENFSEKSC